MRTLHIVFAVVALAALPAAASAQSLQLGADGGMTRFLGEDQQGFGFDAYPGLSAGPLTIEGQIGYHRGDDSHLALSPGAAIYGTTYIPVMLGGRAALPLGLVHPWVGAHGGFSHVIRRVERPLADTVFTDREWEPAFNVGGGVDLRFGGFGVGAALWYHGVMDPDDPMRALHVGLNLTVAL